MHATRSRWSVLISLLAAFAVALPPGAPGAVYTTVNSPLSVNWNTAPWNPVEPPSVDQRVGLLTGGGVMEINTAETAGGLLVGWQGSYSVNMTGGSLTLGSAPNDNALYVSENTGGQGTFNHSGGTVDTPSVVFNRTGAANNGVYTLSGTGVLRTGSVAKPQGTATFNFNGGTLQATAGGAGWFAAGITANVQAGGAVIDTQNFDVTVNSALLNGGGGGGLTKLGSGVLRLAGANNYTGLTTVSAGTLQIGTGTGAAPLGAASFSVAAPATLVFHGNADNNEFTTQSIGGAGDVVFRGQQAGYFTFRNAYSGTLNYTGRTIVNLDDNPGNQWWQGTLWLEKDNVFSSASVLEMQSGKIYMRNSGAVGQTVAGLTGNAGTFITTDQGVQKLNINVAAGQSYTYAGVIGADDTGTGNNNVALTKSGAGTQVLTGANTYTGGTTVNDGTLQIGAGGASGTIVGNVTVNTPGQLVFNRSDTLTFAGAISGSGAVVKEGGGSLIATGNLTHSGGTAVNAGTLQIGTGTGAAPLGAASFSVAAPATLVFHGNADNNEFTTQSIGGAGDVVFRGQQAGYFTFRNAYSGTLSYTGRTIVNLDDNPGNQWWQGTLWLEKDNVFSSASVLEMQSGKIYMRNSGAVGQTVAGLTGNAGTFITTDQGVQKLNLNVAAGQTYSYAGVIGADDTGTGNNNVALTKSGAGTQILTGANTYTGGTTVNGGILQIGNGGTTGVLPGNVTLNTPGNLTFNRSDVVTFGGNSTGTGSLTQAGSGTVVLGGTVGHTGLTTVSSGVLQIGNNNALNNVGGGNYFVAGGAKLAFSRNIDSTDFTFQSISGPGDVEFRGQQNGYFRFQLGYGGTLNYTGRTIVNLDDNPGNQWYQGVLWLEKDNVLPNSTVLDMQSGKIYIRNSEAGGQTVAGLVGNVGTFITTDRATVQKLNVTVAPGQTYTYAGVIGADGTGTGNNNVALTKSGAGTQVLTGANTYTGGTTVNGGVLQVGNTSALGTGSLTVDGGSVDLNNFAVTVSSLAGSGGTITDRSAGAGATMLTVNQVVSTTFAGAIQDGPAKSLAFSKLGSGVLTLAGASTYSGGTSVNGGFLTLGVDNALPVGGVLAFAPAPGVRASLNMNGKNQTLRGLVAAAGAPYEGDIYNNDGNPTSTLTLNVPLGQTYTYANQIGPDAGWRNVAVVKGGPGTQIFAGNNLYTGGTTVSGGTLQFGANSPAGVRPPGTVTLQNGANLAFSHNYDYAGISVPNVTGNGNLVLLGQGAGYYSIRPGLTTTLNYSGMTTLQLDSQLGSSYRGALFVEPGSVGLPSTTVLNIVSGKLDLRQNQTIAGLTGTGGYVTTDGAGGSRLIIDFASSAGPFTYAGVIGAPPEVGYNSANVSLEKRGTGTQILTGANNYTGGTAVTAGRLLAQNTAGSATGTGLVTVSGGALGGGNAAGTIGFIGGPVLITGTGALAPGNSPGILTLDGGLTFTDGAYTIEIQGNVAGTLYDQTKVTAGNVALGSGVADLVIDSTGYTPGAEDLLWIINNVGAGSTTGFFAGLPEGGVVRIAETNFAVHYNANYGLGQLTGGNDVALAFVPEPSTLVLMALGGAALFGALRRWTRRRHATEART